MKEVIKELKTMKKENEANKLIEELEINEKILENILNFLQNFKKVENNLKELIDSAKKNDFNLDSMLASVENISHEIKLNKNLRNILLEKYNILKKVKNCISEKKNYLIIIFNSFIDTFLKKEEKIFKELDKNEEKIINEMKNIMIMAEKKEEKNKEIIKENIKNLKSKKSKIIEKKLEIFKCLKEEIKQVSKNIHDQEKVVASCQKDDLSKFLNKKINEIDLLFILDTSNSMQPYITDILICIRSFLLDLQKKKTLKQFRVAILIYSDFKYKNHLRKKDFVLLDKILPLLDPSITAFESQKNSDVLEDIDGALKEALELDWYSLNKIIFHICDAPPHGNVFSNTTLGKYNPFNSCKNFLQETFIKFKTLEIEYNLFAIGNKLDETNKVFEKYFNDAKNSIHPKLNFRDSNYNFKEVSKIEKINNETLLDKEKLNYFMNYYFEKIDNYYKKYFDDLLKLVDKNEIVKEKKFNSDEKKKLEQERIYRENLEKERINREHNRNEELYNLLSIKEKILKEIKEKHKALEEKKKKQQTKEEAEMLKKCEKDSSMILPEYQIDNVNTIFNLTPIETPKIIKFDKPRSFACKISYCSETKVLMKFFENSKFNLTIPIECNEINHNVSTNSFVIGNNYAVYFGKDMFENKFVCKIPLNLPKSSDNLKNILLMKVRKSAIIDYCLEKFKETQSWNLFYLQNSFAESIKPFVIYIFQGFLEKNCISSTTNQDKILAAFSHFSLKLFENKAMLEVSKLYNNSFLIDVNIHFFFK